MQIFSRGNYADSSRHMYRHMSFQVVTLVIVSSLILTVLSCMPSASIPQAKAALGFALTAELKSKLMSQFTF